MDHLRWKADRTAAEHNPDPLTYKAFLSEFKQGVAAGVELQKQSVADPVSVPIQGHISVTDDLVTSSAQDLLDLAKRLVAASTRGVGSIGINEHRLVPKMSGILSTFFYNMGKLEGMKKGESRLASDDTTD